MNTVEVKSLVELVALRNDLKVATRDFRESLPAMPAALFSRLVERTVAVNVVALAEKDELIGWTDSFRLLTSQKEQLDAAKKDHAARINTAEKHAEIVASVTTATFKTFKVRITSKGEHKFSLTGSLKV